VTEVEERGGKDRRDANHEHFNEFWKGQIRAYKRFFGPIGPEQTHLQILATLPEFQRRGHGSSLCRWAMELVRRDKLKDMSVMASPMGYELYKWLGFERVGTFYIHVPGEDQKLVLQAMMYRAPKLRPARTAGDAEGMCVVS
jgi:ribosomal protein S18 acetylase RimI-like enzyme